MASHIPYAYKDQYGSYYVRFVFPKHVRANIPGLSRDIRRSLRTKLPNEAKVRSRRYLAYIEKVIEEFCMNPNRDKNYYLGLITLVDPFGNELSVDHPDPAQESEQVADLYRQWQKLGFYDVVKSEFAHNSGMQAAIEADRRLSGALNDNETITAADVVDMYIRDNRNELEEQSLTEVYNGLEVLVKFLGDKDVRLLTSNDMKEFRDILPQLPARFLSNKKLSSMPFMEAIQLAEKNNHARLAQRTVKKKLDAVRELFKWLSEEEKIIEDDFSAILQGKKLKLKGNQPEKGYKPFTSEHLRKLISCYVYKGNIPTRLKDMSPYKFWIPLIGLFSGARLEEICQLYTQDIVNCDGVWMIRISPDDVENVGKQVKIKSKSSIRDIPIHPKLIQIGLLEYREEVIAEGHNRLFPSLKNNNQKNKYGFDVSKWFGDTLRPQLGYEKREGYCFHSLRKNVIQNLQQKPEIPREIRKALAGHSVGGGDVHEEYEGAYLAQVLQPYLNQLEYPALNFDEVSWSDFKKRKKEWLAMKKG